MCIIKPLVELFEEEKTAEKKILKTQLVHFFFGDFHKINF